eukprot:sb/3476665/
MQIVNSDYFPVEDLIQFYHTIANCNMIWCSISYRMLTIFGAMPQYGGMFTLRVLEVMPPQWSDFILTANIPHGKADVLVFYCLDIETWWEKEIVDIMRINAISLANIITQNSAPP